MILGITGAKASGKGEVAKLLQNKGFELFSMGDLVRKEAKERGVEPNSQNLQKLGITLSKEEGENFVIKRIISKIQNNKNYVIEGFRFVEDILPFKKRKDFFLIGVIASLEVRWKRMENRKRADDISNFEAFKNFDNFENNSSNGQNVTECLKLADFTLVNDSNMENLNKKLDFLLQEIKC